MTRSGKTAGVPGQAEQTHQRRLSKSLRHPQKEEEEEDTEPLQQKEKPQTQKQGPPEKVACS